MKSMSNILIHDAWRRTITYPQVFLWKGNVHLK